MKKKELKKRLKQLEADNAAKKEKLKNLNERLDRVVNRLHEIDSTANKAMGAANALELLYNIKVWGVAKKA